MRITKAAYVGLSKRQQAFVWRSHNQKDMQIHLLRHIKSKT